MKRKLFLSPERVVKPRTEEPEGYYSQPFVKEVSARYEDGIPNMVTYGHSGGDWSTAPRGKVFSGRDTLKKRIAKDEEYYVTRMIKANDFDTGYGYNKLEYNNTSGRLPIWLCDLTDFDNATRIRTHKSTGTTHAWLVSHAAKPWYVLNFRQTSGTITPDVSYNSAAFAEEAPAMFFDQLDYRYLLETTTVRTTDTNYYDPTTATGTISTDATVESSTYTTQDRYADKTPILKWVDFRGLFYGVKSREVKWNIDVVQFAEDYLDPVPMDMMGTYPSTVDGRTIDRRMQERAQFWYQMAKTKTSHPLLPKYLGDVSLEKGVRYLARYSFKVRESLTDADQINKVEKKINLRLNKILNRSWKRDLSAVNSVRVDDIYGEGKGLDDPTSANARTHRSTTRIHPRSRVYLMISATCPKSDTEGADVTIPTATGIMQDETLVRNVEFNVPFRYAEEQPGPLGVHTTNGYIGEIDDGAYAANPNLMALPVYGTVNGATGVQHLQQMDDVDIKLDGENATITATSDGTEAQGRMTVGQKVYTSATGLTYDREDTLYAATVTGTSYEDPGKDNPTFDFILRMKYVI